jgi:signal transduction histidine kinase
MNLLSLQILLTFITGIFNFVLALSLSIMMLGRGGKKHRDMYYFVMALFASSVWAMSVAVIGLFELYSPLVAAIARYIAYLAPVCIPYAVLKFVQHFGVDEKNMFLGNRYQDFIPILIVLGVLIPELGLLSYQTIDGYPNVQYGGAFHWIYAGYYVLYFALSFLLIGFRAQYEKNKKLKNVLRVLIFILGAPFLVSIITNLGLQIMGVQNYFLIGPLSSLITTGGIIYLLFKHNLFQVRTIYIEMTVLFAIMSVVLFLRFYFVDTQDQYFVNSFLLVLFFFLSSVLTKEIVRGVYEEKKLDKINEDLAQLVVTKDEFMRIASLQLRTPLTVIIGYLSMILETHKTGNISLKTKQDLGKAFVSAQNLNAIVNDLLSANDINSGEFRVKIQQEIDLVKLIKLALDSKEVFFQEKKTQVSFQATGTNPLVDIDKPKIFEVVNNLIDNAVFYGHGKVWVNLELYQESVKLSIKDNGVGIAKEDVKRIWKKFERGKKSPLINPNGSGLGLYLAKMIVQKHHGKIYVESKGSGQGSEFVIELPRTSAKPIK